MTVAFVMLAEVLIFVPSVARFRSEYLTERLEKAQIASLAALAAPGGEIDPDLAAELLKDAEVFSIALQRDQSRMLMLMRPITGMVDETFDLRAADAMDLIGDALACLVRAERRFVRIIGAAELLDGEHVEIVVDEGALKDSILDYGLRIFQLSLLISAITGGMVFLAVNAFLVRPMRRVIAGMASFREDPEDGSRIYQASGAGGEIGQAEVELARAQAEVQAALKQKSRLAALGAAVARINHDLRNMLASAQLLADRLEGSADPTVKRVGPKLIASLDRAIRLCRQTLEFGRAEEAPPVKAPVSVAMLAGDVFAALGLEEDGAAVRTEVRSPADMMVSADADQLFRALLNLARNAVQAMEAAGGGHLLIEARRASGRDEIDIVDDGPGLPPKARENLFKPFRGAVRKGGSGLGLAIAAELARGHGGGLELIETGPAGSRFRLSLPAAAESPAARRRAGAVVRSF